MNILEFTGAIFWGAVIGFAALWCLPDFWPKDTVDDDEEPPLPPGAAT